MGRHIGQDHKDNVKRIFHRLNCRSKTFLVFNNDPAESYKVSGVQVAREDSTAELQEDHNNNHDDYDNNQEAGEEEEEDSDKKAGKGHLLL